MMMQVKNVQNTSPLNVMYDAQKMFLYCVGLFSSSYLSELPLLFAY